MFLWLTQQSMLLQFFILIIVMAITAAMGAALGMVGVKVMWGNKL